jgi:hypothetical protein
MTLKLLEVALLQADLQVKFVVYRSPPKSCPFAGTVVRLFDSVRGACAERSGERSCSCHGQRNAGLEVHHDCGVSEEVMGRSRLTFDGGEARLGPLLSCTLVDCS